MTYLPSASRLAWLFFACMVVGCRTTGPAGPAPADSDAREPLEALYWERQSDARTGFTEADVAFMSGMIGHHAQALLMSRLAAVREASPEVQRLAARIINAQRDEIETMQRWLRQRGLAYPTYRIDGTLLTIGLEQPPPGDPMPPGAEKAGQQGHAGHRGRAQAARDQAHTGHGSTQAPDDPHQGHVDHANMPGMLSQAQLDELAAAEGEAFDQLFLAYMIQHHSGAVFMVDELLSHDGAALDGAVYKLATDIHAEQTTEIARMQLILERLLSSR